MKKKTVSPLIFFLLLLLFGCTSSGSLRPSITVLPESPFQNSFYARIHRTLIHYRLWQPEVPSRGKVLLVHGLAGSTFSFRYTAPFLAEQGYTVLAADLPAFGYSDRKQENIRGPEGGGELLWELILKLEREGIVDTAHECWVLAGHSMGGRVITYMAEQSPEKTGKLIYIAGAVLDNPDRSWIFKLPFAERILTSYLESILTSPGELRDLLESAYGTAVPEKVFTGYREPLIIPGTPKALTAFTRVSSQELSAEPEKMTAPALLIWGENDTWVPPEQGRVLSGIIPDSKLHVIPGAAHLPMESHAGTTNKIIIDFLK